jgi:hypothetical protein
MRKITGVIRVLETVELGASVYDTNDARWLRKFKDLRPDCITLTFNDDQDPRAPIFRAELTPRGRQYLNSLREENHEVPRLRQAIS